MPEAKSEQRLSMKPSKLKALKEPWTKSEKDVLKHYGVSMGEGLTEGEANARRKKFGINKIEEIEEESSWKILVEQFKSLLVGLLTVATVVSFLFGQYIEGVAIAVVLVINAAIGFITEMRAVRSMESLRELTKVGAKVLREGEVKKINAEDLVPGDIVVLESGDIVPADLRVVETSKLKVDESALTGESVPVDKETGTVEKETPLAERKNMLYNGTFLTRGSAKAVVVSTGMRTEMGEISSFIKEAGEEEETPLERRLDKLAQKLIPLLLVIAAIVGVAGILQGRELLLMIETAIALAVATVPEGLPIVATIALARGMWRMAERNALVNRLSSVETLGSTNVICTDKTGTLTENEMTVSKYALKPGEVEVSGTGLETEGEFSSGRGEMDVADDEILEKALETGVLCNNASYSEDEDERKFVGDPMEVSLLVSGLKAGMKRPEVLKSKPEVREVSFDPSTKMMATYHERDGSYQVAVKGAPEAVLEVSSSVLTEDGETELGSEERKRWLEKNDEMAEDGLRVLALATKEVEDPDEEPYEGLTFLGLVAMMDPPRSEVKPAIDECQSAGIRVIMVTGDHAKTARKIAYEVGLVDNEEVDVVEGGEIKAAGELDQKERDRFSEAPVFARVEPKQKLDIIEIHQEKGSVVAMTGDGVNDAPALKKADIGIAMGKRGTQVAREAADMILQDDNFSTIAKAVEQGRVIFRNIRKFIFYLLSCNLSELFVVLLASLFAFPLPILPLQILFLNVVTDIFPAFALGVGEGSRGIMNEPPRSSDEPILNRGHWTGIGTYGVLIGVVVLASFVIAAGWYGMPPDIMDSNPVITVSFLTLAFSQLWHVFNMRDRGSPFLRNDITLNRYVWMALALCTGLLIMATYLPGLSDVLRTASIGLEGWGLVLVMSAIPWIVGQIWNSVAPNIVGKTK